MEKLALFGGKPIRESSLPFCLPAIDQKEMDAVFEVLKSGWLTTGQKCQDFENKFSDYTGSKNAITVNSCTAGLHLILASYGIGQGDEVLVPSYTFSATANVVMHQNANPIFVDVRKDFNIDPDQIKKSITKKTKALIAVHFAGLPCLMDEIADIAEKNNLIVIEDAAHAVGSIYKGKMVGTLGNAAAFSFYATKNLTTGEGGMVTTDDDKIAGRLRVLRLHGISKDAWKRYGKGGNWYYELTDPGFKYNLSDIQAAIGLVQLYKLDDLNKRRKQIADLYTKHFETQEGLIFSDYYKKPGNSWHLYPLLLDLDNLEIDRSEFIKVLEAENISSSVHFIPLHLQPFYKIRFNLKKGILPVTEWLYEREVSLPLYPTMTDKDVMDVILSVKKILNFYKKK